MTVADPITRSTSSVAPLRMTEEEFVAWAGEKARAEWVAGEVQLKMPINEIHDLLQRAIAASLEALIRRRGLGHVRGDNFAMRLPERPSRREADVIFVSKENESRLGETLLVGPADLAIEIVSVSSVARDYREKYLEYEAAGIREYWIIDPLAKLIEAYALDPQARKYAPLPVDGEKRVHSNVVAGWWLSPASLFKDPPPDALELIQLLGIV